MVRPIAKYAVQVHNVEELGLELSRADNIAMSGRRGPVLIDVPMNVQQDFAGEDIVHDPQLGWESLGEPDIQAITRDIDAFFASGSRPLILFGAGVGLSGSHRALGQWLEQSGIPFVGSWNALTFFNHGAANYLGQIGVYGNRGANTALQNSNLFLVLGSRLHNQQPSRNQTTFPPGSPLHVIHIYPQKLKKNP